MSPHMRVLWRRHGLTAVLSLAALTSIVVLGYETQWGRAALLALPTASTTSRAGEIVATLPAFALPPLDSAFKETGERPLFTPSRRLAAVNTASAPAMKKGQFKLSGTTVNNNLTIAFLLEAATGKTVRVTKGKEINGMILEAVEPNRVVLKLGDETEELTLRTASSPPVKITAPVPAPVPGSPGSPMPSAQPAVGQPLPRPAVPLPAGGSNTVAPTGSAVLPGFVMPAAPPPPQAQPAATPAETGNPAQRRRRIQAPPQQ